MRSKGFKFIIKTVMTHDGRPRCQELTYGIGLILQCRRPAQEGLSYCYQHPIKEKSDDK